MALNETEKKVEGECQLCLPKKTVIKATLGVSTNYLKHLRTVHESTDAIEDYNKYKQTKKRTRKPTEVLPKGYLEEEAVQPKSLKTQRKITDAFKRNSFQAVDQNVFDKRVIGFLVNTMAAVSIIDNPSFISLFDGMNLKVMSRNTAMKRIDTSYTQIAAKIKYDLGKASYVCTTVDVWSAKRRSFLGLTSHWIDQDYKRCSAALACRRFTGSHTYDKIAEMLDDIHSSFDLSNKKLVATVSDNGSNFVKAFKEFGKEGSDTFTDQHDESEEDGDEDDFEFIHISSNLSIELPQHVRCASHTLNLIATTDVRNAIQKNTSLRTKQTNAIAKCTALWKMAGRPKSNEVIIGVLGHTLSYPGVTRWNSLFNSISQILRSKEKLPTLFASLNLNQMFKESELDYLKEYCSVLKPLATALDILQGEENMYFGYLLPCLGSLYMKFKRMESEGLTVAKPILEACREAFERRFQVYFDFTSDESKKAIIAAFTIPQFKLRWVNNFKDFMKEDLNENITKLIAEAVQKDNLEETFECSDNTGATSQLNDFFELENNDPGAMGRINFKKKIELEVLQYLNDTDTSLAALQNYQTLKKLFFKYNTCLPSSAPVERLFSFAEIINAPRRHALSDTHFEQLVLLKANANRYSI